MQKIVPHLWFDTQAKEAAEFYISVFPNSKITSTAQLHNTPSGDTDIVSFELMGFAFQAISAGPLFKFNPSISFMVNFDPAQDPDAITRIDEIWDKLIAGGKALMPIDNYGFSPRFGWVEDKYGVTWQLILTDPAGEPRPMIMPSLLFVNDVAGKAKEAQEFYLSVFKNAENGMTALYPSGMEPNKEGDVMFSDFKLENQWFTIADSRLNHDYNFNEAISLIVNCEDQDEIDYYWEKLSADPASEQCGWLKDKYGVAWQITPREMEEMLANGTQEQVDRVTQAFLPMKKLDIAKIKAAYEGK